MTHLADVTDRIDRSYSPRGGREERELDVESFKDRRYRKEEPVRDYCRPGYSLPACMVLMIRNSFEIATHNSAISRSQSACPHRPLCYHRRLREPLHETIVFPCRLHGHARRR